MKLCIKLVPGLWSICKFPPYDRVFSTITAFFAGRSRIHDGVITIHLDRADECVNLSRDLFETLRIEGMVLPEVNIAPIQAIAFDEEGLSDAVWDIAPPGYLMVPSRQNIPVAKTWLYDWSVVSLSWDEPVRKRFFPYRSLLLLGPRVRECFFCGSHDHDSKECINCWESPRDGFTAEKMAEIAPEMWVSALRRGSKSIHGIQEGLKSLKEDLRREFKLDFFLKICRTTGSTFNELDTFPLKSWDSPELSGILDAFAVRDRQGFDKSVRSLDEDTGGAQYELLRGINYLLKNDREEAMASWWQAENTTRFPLIKGYACLLQMRLHLLKGNLDGAKAAVERGLQADATAAPLVYWQLVVDALIRDKNRFKTGIDSLKESPRWFMAVLAEPLLLEFEPMVEQSFERACSEAENWTQSILLDMDDLLDKAEKAFGPECTKEFRVELRDWRANVPKMGYAGLLGSSKYMQRLKTRLYEQTGKLYNQFYKQLVDWLRKVNSILERLPRSPSFYSLRSECANYVLRLNRTVRRFQNFRDFKELEGLYTSVDAYAEEGRRLLEKCNEAIEREWRLTQVKKYLIIGSSIVAVTWVVFYIISLILNMLD